MLVTTILLALKLSGELRKKRTAEEKAMEMELAKAKAEQADRLKSAFLATMSHELRTPLNSIIGFSGILLKELPGKLNDEQKKQLNMIKTGANHLLSLINDILDISRIEAGQMEFSMEETDISGSIMRISEIIKPIAQSKGIALYVENCDWLPKIITDRRRFEQIIINIVNNAVKFTQKGEVRISAKIEQENVKISVKDTGIGIREGDIGKIFQPFTQIDTGTARNHEGTGLGLAISSKLAKLLGAEISVKSEYTKGSVFEISLPLKGKDEKTYTSYRG